MMREAVRAVVRSLDYRGRRLAAWYGIAHLADRLALVGVALAAPHDDRTAITIAAVFLGILTLARAFVGSIAQAHAQALLHIRVGESLLARELLRPTALEDDDPEAAVLDGIDIGARIAAGTLPATVADLVGAVLVSGVLVRVATPRMLGAAVAAVVGGAFVMLFARRVTLVESERAWLSQRPLLDRLVSILAARLEIVANGAGERSRLELVRTARTWETQVGRFERATALASRLPLVFGAAMLAGVLLLSSRLVLSDLALSAILLVSALPPFAGAARGIHELTKLSVRVMPLVALLQPVTDDDRPAHADRVAPPDKLSLEAATFRYPTNESDVIRGASLSFVAPSLTVLVGPNGSGKSTLLRLLLAIEAPRTGAYKVDDQLPACDGAALRSHVAYLPQRPYLAERTTVRDAFSLLAPAVDEASALRWIERVGMKGVLIAKDPHDPLAVRLGRLSAGQKQRLAIARIGFLDRRVWLLDEPDASLDADGLAMLSTLFNEERARRIIIVAAHAPSLSCHADRVLHVAAGQITAEPQPVGTRPEPWVPASRSAPPPQTTKS